MTERTAHVAVNASAIAKRLRVRLLDPTTPIDDDPIEARADLAYRAGWNDAIKLMLRDLGEEP